jgi:hypothetical protein
VVGERWNFRIGLAWKTGNWNRSRTIPLKEFYPLFGMTGLDLYNLKKGADLKNLTCRFALRDIEGYAADIRDTAALV